MPLEVTPSGGPPESFTRCSSSRIRSALTPLNLTTRTYMGTPLVALIVPRAPYCAGDDGERADGQAVHRAAECRRGRARSRARRRGRRVRLVSLGGSGWRRLPRARRLE